MKLAASESVTEGHPDKICDQISDAILDAALEQDPNARVAAEVMATPNLIHIGGEITCSAPLDFERISRETLAEIGQSETLGLPHNQMKILTTVNIQSPEISAKVHKDAEDRFDRFGAGDQGVMFGFACDETEELMPLPIMLAHEMTRQLTERRKTRVMPYLRPDGKTQIVVEYDYSGQQPIQVRNMVVSTQHDPEVDKYLLEHDVWTYVMEPTMEKYRVQIDLEMEDRLLLVNPAGSFVLGGASADAGLTGRKIIADSYGGAAHHGGGAFSGKDATKVDRSAAYAARWAAKHIVALGLARRAEIQVAYAIGEPRPVGINVETFGTEQIEPSRIAKAVAATFDFRPAAIIEELGLTRPIYSLTSVGGHFGKPELPWEQLNKMDALEGNIA